jgi:hypothetical protein
MVSQLKAYFLIYKNEKRPVSMKSIPRKIIDNKMSKGLMKRRNMTRMLLLYDLSHSVWGVYEKSRLVSSLSYTFEESNLLTFL